MTELFLGIGSGCLVQIVELDLEPTPTGWSETIHLEVAGPLDQPGSPCGITLPMPAGSALERAKGKRWLPDGATRKLDDQRFTLSDPALDRSRTLTVHVPDVIAGGRLVVDLRRTLPPGGLRYRGLRANFLQIGAPGPIEAPLLTRDDKRDTVWGRNVENADVALRVESSSPPASLTAAPSTTIEGRITLNIPATKDPLVALYPGSGETTVTTRLDVTLPASERPVGWIVPAPPNTDVEARVQAPSRAIVTTEYGITRIEAPPSEAPSRVTVTWTEPDAPTYGLVPSTLGSASPGTITGWEVDAPGGLIQWDDDGRGWVLAGVHDRPVVPDWGRFLRALDNRFHRQGLPEPSIPGSVRGAPATTELSRQLPALLRTRARVGDWSHDPLWPRKLRSAWRSGAITPTEAALTTRLFARQLGFEADWGFVQADAPPEASAEGSPARFTHPVVIMRGLDGMDDPSFIDPSCEVCATFELPFALWDAPVLSPGLGRTPPPPIGAVSVDALPQGDGDVIYVFYKTHALLARRLAASGVDLTQWLGGPGATGEVEGLDRLGENVKVVVRNPTTLYDPLRLPQTAARVRVRPGKRFARHPAHGMPDIDVVAGPLHYIRETKGHATVETLHIGEAWLRAEDIAAIEAVRFASP
ncbi:MAG: hypothetical protein AAGA48_07650 [Myxococcota bacterium]